MEGQNRYYNFFRDSIGKGEGVYYKDIGHVYKSPGGLQRGFGKIYMRGRMFHSRRGLGFGSTLMSLFRLAKPMLKNLGSKAVNLAADVAKDVIHGDNVKQSALKHLSSEAKTFISKLPQPFSGLIAKPPTSNTSELSVSGESEVPTSNFDQRHRVTKRKYPRAGVIVSRAKKGRGITTKYPALQFL